ncbi:hypothetical protein PCANC_13818 [Puccinia coronata f. sp. avenae]|uniref:Uncharacterized protein n=1 Tax=Puccinia coronata f. sp. avenae TaxID=200324 RepID=A0A2N5UD76_9BASI|nr:hypothetical protein PCANC_16961 [Puccinia coronata f. sp. avenae]PLW35688.1 hypothetical protein PCANC_13818 [Puccinia coronata f. sp. avenae]
MAAFVTTQLGLRCKLPNRHPLQPWIYFGDQEFIQSTPTTTKINCTNEPPPQPFPSSTSPSGLSALLPAKRM